MIFQVLLAIAISFVLYRLYTAYKILRTCRGKFSDRLNGLPKRILVFFIHNITQKKHLKSGAVFHSFIFWGFIIYLISYINDPLLVSFGYSIEILETPGFHLIRDLFGIMVLIGVAIAFFRRIKGVEYLENTLDAWITLILITSVVVLSILMSKSPIGFKADNEALWWAHTMLLLFFMVFVFYSKHMHIFFAPLSVLFTEFDRLLEKDGRYEGSERLDEFHWREVFNAFSCANCGRCDRVCPALKTGSELSPRRIIFKAMRSLAFKKGKIFDYLDKKVIWDCYLCLACTEVCPSYNEHYRIIIQLRRKILSEGIVDEGIQRALININRYGNSFGRPSRLRFSWAKDLGFKDVRKDFAEYLWYVGDYACYHPEIQRISRLAFKVFKKLGLDFGLLPDERNAGNDLRRVGEEGLFELIAEKNIKSLEKAKFNKIITTDPHTYHALKEYRFFGREFEVYHYTQVIYDLLKNAKIKKLNYRVTYHDPCYLGRYNKEYEMPRKILKLLGVELVEMKRNRENSLCCGAGGGGIWKMEERKEKPSYIRVKEASEVADILVVACPKDYVMFLDAVKACGLDLKVVDLIELIAESLEVNE